VQNDVRSRTLHRAAELVGGPEALAKTLCIPEPAVRMWLAGRPIPPEIFLRAVDIIGEHETEAQRGGSLQQGKER
jgi:hypothetical protein